MCVAPPLAARPDQPRAVARLDDARRSLPRAAQRVHRSRPDRAKLPKGNVYDDMSESPIFFEIRNLHAAVDGKEILRGVGLRMGLGEVHALMGPNGSGKSTLAYTLMGHPRYAVTQGEV